MKIITSATISHDELFIAYKQALRKLTGKDEYFEDKEEAEDWAGDAALDLIYYTIEKLGIQIVDDDD
jgi:hypothetical protein